jgi:cytochrome c556
MPAARSASWLFVVSAALFIGGIAFIIAGESARREAVRAEPPPRPMGTPVASVKELMNAMVAPNAATVYDAVAFTSDANGMKEKVPTTDAEWQAIADSAMILVETGNLMLLGNRAVDNAEWVTRTRAFIDRAVAARQAALKKNVDDIFAAGSDLNETCDACHQRYSR